MSRDTTNPATAPMSALMTTVAAIENAASSIEIGPTAARTATAKRTIAVPSLRRLSLSMSVASRRGEPSCLKVETTATGSVAATIAPTTNPSSMRRPVATLRMTATSAAVMSTPGTARSATPPRDVRKSLNSILSAASKTRPGRRTRRTSSGVTWTCCRREHGRRGKAKEDERDGVGDRDPSDDQPDEGRGRDRGRRTDRSRRSSLELSTCRC